MNKMWENRYSMYLGVRDFLDTHITQVKELPAMEEDFTDFCTTLDELDDRAGEYDEGTIGKTSTKKIAKANLVAGLLPVCAALYTYGRKKKNPEVKQVGNVVDYILLRMRDGNLSVKAKAILDTADTVVADLAVSNVTAATLTTVRGLLDTYTKATGTSQHASSDRKGTRKTIEQLFEDADEIIEEGFTTHMEHYRTTYPDFYETFFDVIRVKQLGIRHEKEDTTKKQAAAAAGTPAASSSK